MTTAVDSNVISALLSRERESGLPAIEALAQAFENGTVVISGLVYAELHAHPSYSPEKLAAFLDDLGVLVDFEIGEAVCREAALRYSKFAARRRQAKASQPRRILADFLIGAHALLSADRLLTFDATHYKTNFPDLKVIQPE